MPQITVNKPQDRQFKRGDLFENKMGQVFMLCQVKIGLYSLIHLATGNRVSEHFGLEGELKEYLEAFAVKILPEGSEIELKN